MNLTCVDSCSTDGGYSNAPINILTDCISNSLALGTMSSERSSNITLSANATFSMAYQSSYWPSLNDPPLGTTCTNSTCTTNPSCPVRPTTTTKRTTIFYPNHNPIDECGDICYPNAVPANTTLYNCSVTLTGLTVGICIPAAPVEDSDNSCWMYHITSYPDFEYDVDSNSSVELPTMITRSIVNADVITPVNTMATASVIPATTYTVTNNRAPVYQRFPIGNGTSQATDW
ncbi:unnamed protein product [Rotaria sp. Silwood1]|nr:unnamed protein product [Rotaria sp. Silwood1]